MGFSIPFAQGGLCLRLVAGYSSLSNHLQMQYATTLAMTEKMNETNNSCKVNPPFCARIGSGNVTITA